MPPTINWASKTINVPKSDLTLISGSVYELDVDAFRLDLKAIEASEEGMPFPDTHRHNTEVVISGVTYARTVEFINGYSITFEDGQYTVSCSGANHNIADVNNYNNVSLVINNAAGLIDRVLSQENLTLISNATLDGIVDPSNPVSLRQAIYAILATAVGLADGGGTATITFRDHGDTKDAVEMTVDENGNRTSVTLNFPIYP